MELRSPQLRYGSYLPAFLEPWRMADVALTVVIQKAYFNGDFTGSVDDVVGAFLTRQIDGDFPYVWLDAPCVEIRRDNHNACTAVIVGSLVRFEGRNQTIPMIRNDRRCR